MALDAATLALIKVDYEESSLTVAAIGEKYGHSPSYISRLARIHGWILRTQRLGRTPRMSAVLSQQARALIAHRLCSIINKKLDQMEKDMDSGVLTSPTSNAIPRRSARWWSAWRKSFLGSKKIK